MMENNVIEIKDIKKSFKIYLDKGNTLKEKVLFKNRRKYEKREVLRGISFSVKRGEAIGLIGHNGCGKSTTLKLLTKIIYPDSGEVNIKGRVSSLIELGAGFHPDMSGRQNIYINASIFGLTKDEIDKKVNQIIKFSELEDFIDNPVRTYSSGMYMRLAFAVAINVDADVLLIDEILGVGDAAFQAKCFNKLREIKKNGTTIVIVSHALNQIEQICERVIWIHEGQIKEEGIPRVVNQNYLAYMNRKAQDIAARTENSITIDEESTNIEKDKMGEDDAKRWGSKEIVMENVIIVDSMGMERYSYDNKESFCVRIKYYSSTKIEDVVVGVAIYREDQTYIYGTNTMIDYAEPIELERQGYIELKVNNFPLNAGKYTVDLALHRPDGFNYDFWREVCTITIGNKKSEAGLVSLEHEWSVKLGDEK